MRQKLSSRNASIPILLTFLIFGTSSFCQDRGGTDPRVALPLLKQVLGKGKLSGSLEYWGRCDFDHAYPDFPALSDPSNGGGSSVDLLRRIFAVDKNMLVTQEANGMVRLIETDVPTDLLDLRISHVSFGSSQDEADMFGGPNGALISILSHPEVVAYRKAHKIGPFGNGFAGPGNSSRRQKVSGDLYDVTVRQALDYILQFYPGFWIYENCRSDEYGPGRYVFIAFFETDPHKD
jgi:hypothetical protein